MSCPFWGLAGRPPHSPSPYDQHIGHVQPPDVEVLVLLYLENVAMESTRAIVVYGWVVFDLEHAIDGGANGYNSFQLRFDFGLVAKSKEDVLFY